VRIVVNGPLCSGDVNKPLVETFGFSCFSRLLQALGGWLNEHSGPVRCGNVAQV